MSQGKFSAGEVIKDEKVLATIAEAFNFKPDDFLPGAPIQKAGTGVDFLMIPVRSLKVLENSRANLAKLEELPENVRGEYSLFTTETLEPTSKIHTRMYAPEFGITEDPATGSAAGTLGGYLLHHGLLDMSEPPAVAGGFSQDKGVYKFTIEQGDFMHRPSRIHVEVTGEKGNVQKVRVGGSAVTVAKGEIYF
jgi:trans-2,3-dihydro-3-hydroxyanthranilate isomerase